MSELADRFDAARALADAVLYEGYVLYPYRASAQKNQVRWQFGVLAPRAAVERDGSEHWSCRTECVVDPGDAPVLSVRVRCLQAQHRTLEAPVTHTGGRTFAPVGELEVDGTRWLPWDEAVEHELEIGDRPLLPLAGAACDVPVRVAGGDDVEDLFDAAGNLVGRARRRREPVDAIVRVRADWTEGLGALVKVSVTVENVTEWSGGGAPRDDVVRHSLVAVHTLLAIDDGTFVSLLDPRADAAAAVAGCTNDGTFPVLVGEDDRVMLSSPIILYDHAEIAPESGGDLYDATEIDEILALRVLTLTDDEKAEARATDPRAAAIVDRVDDMEPDAWARLHGTFRELRATEHSGLDAELPAVPWWEPAVDAAVDPWSDTVVVAGVPVRAGSRVRLHPSRRADAHDMFFRDLVATVAGVFHDVDGELHVAVTLDDDPASAELIAHGRYLFFHPDEVEPLTDAEAAS